jgi:arylformamidase
MARLWDISPTVTPSLAVWPGDTPPSRQVLRDMRRGDNLTLSTLRATVHLGSHADAPSHYGETAPAIDERPLKRYFGPCHVVRVDVPRGTRIPLAALSEPPRAERILFATGTYPDPDRFNSDFAAFSTELLEHLAECGVRLVGIDTPSIDLFDSKDLPAHAVCLRRDLAILEGLVFDGVPEGEYELIALPLKLAGFDASPVRAVLREYDDRDRAGPSSRT